MKMMERMKTGAELVKLDRRYLGPRRGRVCVFSSLLLYGFLDYTKLHYICLLISIDMFVDFGQICLLISIDMFVDFNRYVC